MIRTVILSLLLITGCASNEVPQQIDNAYFDELFDAAYFEKSADPFQDMHQITTELAAESEDPARFSNAFNVWYWEKHGRYEPNKIHYRDDAEAIYITLDIDIDVHPDVKLKLKDNLLTMTGDFVYKGRWAEGRLKLDQKLPVPANLDPLSKFAWKNGEEYIIRIDKLGS